MEAPNRRVGVALAGGFAVLAIAIPVLAAPPSPSAAPVTSPAPEQAAKPDLSEAPDQAAKPDKSAKPDRAPETTVSLRGTIHEKVDIDGRPTYTMTVDGKSWSLSAGPPWFWGAKNPLSAFVGKSVTVAGTTHAGDAEVDVETVDGEALRDPGKPPWAGGPWVVGSTHPGWKDWMADGKPGNGLGREGAPGQIKKASPAP